jgi:hypothetical protein
MQIYFQVKKYVRYDTVVDFKKKKTRHSIPALFPSLVKWLLARGRDVVRGSGGIEMVKPIIDPRLVIIHCLLLFWNLGWRWRAEGLSGLRAAILGLWVIPEQWVVRWGCE